MFKVRANEGNQFQHELAGSIFTDFTEVVDEDA